VSVAPEVLEFASDDPFAARALASLFHSASATAAEPTLRYLLRRSADGYTATGPGKPPFGPAGLGEAWSFLEWRATEDLLSSAGGDVFLHAAGISLRSGMVLLVGESGSGKSTLAAHLLARGHTAWGDDLVRFAPASGLFSGVPRSFKLDYNSLSSLPLVESKCAQGAVGTLLAPSWTYVSPAAIRRSWEAPSGRPSAVVLLQSPVRGQPPLVERVSEGVAAIRVSEALIGLRGGDIETRGRLTVAVIESLSEVVAYRARGGEPLALALALERELG
jgi:energy-coupling factor transporter ATP-binding protein EcfA2